MGIDRLERVMWRLRKRHPGLDVVTNKQLRLAIMYECGTSPMTVVNNRKALKELGWIKPHGTSWVKLTGADIRGDLY